MSHVPTGHHALTPFLLVERGQAFIEFTQEAFGADVKMNHSEGGRVVHAEIVIAGCTIELGTPNGEFTGTRSAFHLYVPDADAAYARAVEGGCEPLFPVEDQPYGERSGGVKDPWGNDWYLGTVTDMATRTSTEPLE